MRGNNDLREFAPLCSVEYIEEQIQICVEYKIPTREAYWREVLKIKKEQAPING